MGKRLFFVVLLGILLTGCSKQEIHIVAVGDYDGQGQTFARAGVAGMELAIQDLGKNDLYKIMPVDIDQLLDPDFVDGELANYKPDFFVGPYLSSELEIVYPIFAENGYFGFIPSATLNVLEGNDDYIYRLINTTDDQIDQFAQLMVDKEFSSTLILYDVNNQGYSKTLAQGIFDTGLIPDASIAMVEDDFSKDISNWSTESCDSVIIVAAGKKSGSLVQALRIEGVNVPIYLSPWAHSPDTIDYMGMLTDNVLVYTNGYAMKEDAYKSFADHLQEDYGLVTSTASQYAYEAIYFLDYLNENTHIKKYDEVKTYLLENPDFNGPFFNHVLDQYGQGTHPMELLSIEEGVYVHEEE